MRLTPAQVEIIRGTAKQLLGSDVQITLFGSRVDDSGKGGDVDLMVEVTHPLNEPALISAQLASQVSRGLGGRKVDVVIKAPNLMPQAIHQIAQQTGVVL
jgi:predicted nucleotidyltransferase